VIAPPAQARVEAESLNPGRAYVTARAASISGDHERAAELYASLASGSSDSDLAQRAIGEAVSAGSMELALRLARQVPDARNSVNSRLLLIADALKRGADTEAVQLLSISTGGSDLSFWEPMVRAWNAAERRDAEGVLAILAAVPRSSAFAPFADEQAALILLKLRKTAQAEPYARRAADNAGPREYRLRLALAAGFAAAGDRQRALSMVDDISEDKAAIVRNLDEGSLKGLIVDSSAKAFADQLLALATEMWRSRGSGSAPVSIAQIARYAAPGNSAASVLLGNFLAHQDRTGESLQVLRSIRSADPLKPEALDGEVRVLLDIDRLGEAETIAKAAASRPQATSGDFARLGDVYVKMKRHDEAAEAYGQAARRLSQIENADSGKVRIWPLLLLQANALNSAGRWPEAQAVLGSAIGIAPAEPLVLNFLGYAKLEHDGDLDAAEALIRKASELAPDDASITDSLGWALFKRGRFEEAIEVLQRAAMNDPTQAEIQEHLGDALYAAGRRFEARFAWQAALATAEDEDIARINQKIEGGAGQPTAAR
jgi:tetratricopeptide (TPR) repeat protein